LLQRCIQMDPERVPVLPQSEITPPVHALLREDAPAPDLLSSSNPRTTVKIDTNNWVPYAGNASSNSEKEFIPSPLPAHLPESNAEKRESNINEDRFPHSATRIQTGIDWIVPTEEVGVSHTVGERLQPTLDVAIAEKNKYTRKAKWTGLALNLAIGLQVLLGSLTTGLSAQAVSGGKSSAAATTALGAIATLVASYLARARGSNEPELSITRTKDLEQFIRECQAFLLDHGHLHGMECDADIARFRRRFEELLGNANGERKLAPPV